VLPVLVPGSVFKTVGRRVMRVAGGFDSHALPPFSFAVFFRYSRMVKVPPSVRTPMPCSLRMLLIVRCEVDSEFPP